jgi:hypothetical protein
MRKSESEQELDMSGQTSMEKTTRMTWVERRMFHPDEYHSMFRPGVFVLERGLGDMPILFTREEQRSLMDYVVRKGTGLAEQREARLAMECDVRSGQ